MNLEISNPMQYQAALYIRLSKEDENEGPSESVNNQKSMLSTFARQQRLPVYDTYVDDGWSGTNFDRPAFRRMIADIEAKKVNMVITKDMSRLGRDYIATGHYMERYFPEHRVRYISILDGVDTGVDSTANDITPFRAIMNDMYAKDISKKISSVKHDKQRKGLFIGGKPLYGYKMHPTEKNKIVIDDEAAAMVRRIFAMALEGVSCRQIAMRLNAEGVPTPAAYAGLLLTRQGPYSGLWTSERIADMLHNEMYIGNMVQGRTRKVSYKSKKCIHQKPEDWIIVPGTHEPIVDRDTFDRAARMIESRKYTRTRTYDFLLKGFIYCHECGHPLAVINRKNKRGEDQLYFVCRTYQRFPKSGVCTGHCIKEQRVTEAVVGRIREVCERYLQADELLPLADKTLLQAQAEAENRREMAALRERIDSLDQHLDKLYMDKLEGTLEEADFQRIYRKVRDERGALERRLAVLGRPDMTPEKRASEAERLVRRFIETVPTNRGLLLDLVDRVELTKDRKIIIKFRFRELEAIS